VQRVRTRRSPIHPSPTLSRETVLFLMRRIASQRSSEMTTAAVVFARNAVHHECGSTHSKARREPSARACSARASLAATSGGTEKRRLRLLFRVGLPPVVEARRPVERLEQRDERLRRWPVSSYATASKRPRARENPSRIHDIASSGVGVVNSSTVMRPPGQSLISTLRPDLSLSAALQTSYRTSYRPERTSAHLSAPKRGLNPAPALRSTSARPTQNPVPFGECGFDSHLRH
jgi:hypothetical protein